MFLGAFGDGTSQKLLTDGNGVPSAGVGKIEAEKLRKIEAEKLRKNIEGSIPRAPNQQEFMASPKCTRIVDPTLLRHSAL